VFYEWIVGDQSAFKRSEDPNFDIVLRQTPL
jgi:hypothetical protein